MSHKRGRKRKKTDRVDVLAGRLPAELRSFKNWHYSEGGHPTGLRDYLVALSDWLGDRSHLTAPVMNAAGMSAADWYRRMLSKQ